MRGSKIFFLVLIVAILNIDYVLSHPKKLLVKKTSKPKTPTTGGKKVSGRPGFINIGPFTSMKKATIQKPASVSLHLAHVFPWSSISACVDKYAKKNQWSTELNNFINEIFQIDDVAEAPTKWLNGGKPDSNSFITHEEYLEDMDASPSLGLGPTATMIDQNRHMKIETKKELKNRDITKIKRYLNSAPANLRYGEAKANIKVNDRLDPMGDSLEELSPKEELLFLRYVDCGQTNKEHFGTDGQYYYIPSSSSPNGLIKEPY